MPEAIGNSDSGMWFSPVVDNAELETVELMLALESQDVMQSGFEDSVQAAAASLDGEMLFQVPAPPEMPFQRAALIMLPSAKGSVVVLATLNEQGNSIELREETEDTSHLFRLGEAYMDVATRFRM
jgi:hypothetical protein